MDREERRSFYLNVINGALFNFAERLIDPYLVLTWFVSQLSSSNFLAGLVAPLGDAGWYLPQIFVSTYVQRMERKMPSYTYTAIIRLAAWLFLALAVFFTDSSSVLLATFFSLYLLARLVSGIAGIAFFEVTAKTVSPRRLGSLFALRLLLGGILGISAGWIVKEVLSFSSPPFPKNFAILFALYCLITAPAMGAFIAIREPPGRANPQPVTIGEQWRRAGHVLKEDRMFFTFILSQVALALAGASTPFFTVFAEKILQATPGMLGLYLSVRVAAQLVSNLPWGLLTDRFGERLILMAYGLGNAVTLLIALGMSLWPEGPAVPYLMVLVFSLNGAFLPAGAIVGASYPIKLSPEEERPLYIGLYNTIMGIATLLSGFGGIVVDVGGFRTLFALSFSLYIVTYYLARKLPL
ncbi:MAG: MFS transporter [Anaerolineae bacterium]|nr:MFS transporter [Anaerolineae bacterium]MDW8102561.1 MFS transporter [Anaerolineae bacterium]